MYEHCATETPAPLEGRRVPAKHKVNAGVKHQDRLKLSVFDTQGLVVHHHGEIRVPKQGCTRDTAPAM